MKARLLKASRKKFAKRYICGKIKRLDDHEDALISFDGKYRKVSFLNLYGLDKVGDKVLYDTISCRIVRMSCSRTIIKDIAYDMVKKI